MLFTRTNTVMIDRGIAPEQSKQRQSYALTVERMLLWVDLHDLPEGVTINAARLVLGVIGPVGAGTEVRIARILRQWDPMLATWDERMADVAWGEPGGKDGVDFGPWSAAAVAVPSGTTPATPVAVAFDVTDDLRVSQRLRASRPGWVISGTARVGGVRNIQLPCSPALSVKYSGAKAAALQAGLTTGGI